MLKVKPLSGKFKEDHDLIGDMVIYNLIQGSLRSIIIRWSKISNKPK